MAYLNWYEYMKNPYEDQSKNILKESKSDYKWSDLITGNKFCIEPEKLKEILMETSKYIKSMIKNKEFDKIFSYLRGEEINKKEENFNLWLFPQLPYLDNDSKQSVPRLMDYFSMRTGLLFAIMGNECIDKDELRIYSYLSAVLNYVSDEETKNIINNEIKKDYCKFNNIMKDVDLILSESKNENDLNYELDLVKGGVVKVKEYLLATNKIKEIRGASMILDKINRETIPNEIDKDYILESIVYAGGGNILVVLPKGKGQLLAKKIEKIYEETTVVAQNVAIATTVKLKDLSTLFYKNTMFNVEYLLKERQMSKVDFRTQNYQGNLNYIADGEKVDMYKTDNDNMLCTSCNNKKAEYLFNKEKLCLSCLHKNIIGGKNAKQSFYKEFNDYCASNKFKVKDISVNTLEDIKSNNTNSIGVIYGDGNNMGAVIKKVQNILQMKYFSNKTENSIKEAVYGALSKNLKYGDFIEGRFEVIALGGDDIFIVVPGEKAIDISKDIGNRFDNVFYNYTENSDDNLTMSLGITIAKYDKPVQYLFDMAMQLLKTAKGKAKKVKKGTMDFIVLETDASFASNVKFLRKKLNTDYKNLTLKPYTFDEIENMLNILNVLKEEKDGHTLRSLAYRFMEASLKMNIEEGNLFYAYNKVKLKKQNLEKIYKFLEDAYEVFNGKTLYLKKDSKYFSIWLDVVELWDYVSGGDMDA